MIDPKLMELMSGGGGGSKQTPMSGGGGPVPPASPMPADAGRIYPNFSAMGAVAPLMGMSGQTNPQFTTPAPAYDGAFWKQWKPGDPVLRGPGWKPNPTTTPKKGKKGKIDDD
jgi:hypothetical protein